MLRNKGWIMAVLALAAGSPLVGTSVAEAGCMPVELSITFISDVFQERSQCNGYMSCQYFDVEGSLEGEFWAYWSPHLRHYWVPQAVTVLAADDVLVMSNGELWAEERGVAQWYDSVPYVASLLITGGNGDYEGATGWLAALIDSETPGGPQEITGQVCTP